MSEDRIAQRLAPVRLLGEAVCAALREEVRKLGLPADDFLREGIEGAAFELAQDPYSREETLTGTWRDADGAKLGDIMFHGDGSFYAEYDVVRAHPGDKRWFVEAVTAWGRDGTVKTEPKLLPVVG